MFLASRLEISSHAAFAEGSNLDMIGSPRLGTPQSCTCCHRSKQQLRVTNFTLSLSPRESVGSNGAKAGDSTYNTTNADCLFLHVEIVWAAIITEGKKGSRSLLPIQIQKAVLPLIAGSFTSFLMSQVESAAGIVRITRTRRGRQHLPQTCTCYQRSNNKFV